MQATKDDLALYAHVENKRRRTYCAMVHRLDVNVGKIVAATEAAGLAEKTLIVFFSDNGGPVDSNASLNAPLNGQKGILLEGGMRVPFVMSWKGEIPAGETYDHPVSALDCAPTFVAAAGGESSPGTFDGVDLVPFLTGTNAALPHDALRWRFTISAALREGPWKLVRLPDRLPLLFNIERDISEQHDVALENVERTRAMLKKLGDWDVRLPHPVFLEGAVWKKRQLGLYDREYPLTQPQTASFAPPKPENWTRFRGPSGQGETSSSDLPTKWSPNSGIAWKTPIPGSGWSSPIVFQNSVFLTTATDENRSCRVIRIDRKSGKIVWNREVFRQVPRKKERENSYATPTPTTDGEHVYAVFGDGSFAAVDFDGKIVWSNREAQFYSQHGLGASPILYRDLLIMTFDGSAETGELRIGWQLPWDNSYVIALDKHTGKQRWKTMRGTSRIAHLTPAVLREKGRENLILSAAGDVVQAFHPKDGRIVWTVDSEGEGVVPSPVIGDGLIFTISGFMKHKICTVRTGGKGNVTKTHVAWQDDKSIPRVPSMVYQKPYLYSVLDKSGIVVCRQAESGEIVWRERVGGAFYSSPIITPDRIYLLSREGEMVIIKTGSKYELIGKSTIDEPCQASPAVYGNQLFIRSEKSLFCVEGVDS